MPIDTPDRSVEVAETNTTTVEADALHIDRFECNDPTRTSPALTITATPYKKGTPNLYASKPLVYKTSNLYAALAHFEEKGYPQMRLAFEALLVGIGMWDTGYLKDRMIEWEQAVDLAAQADAAKAAAETEYNGSIAQGKPPSIVVPLQEAFNAATANATIAAARVAQAKAAYEDPANPPL